MVSAVKPKRDLIKKQGTLRRCKWNTYFSNEADGVSNYTLHNLKRYNQLHSCPVRLMSLAAAAAAAWATRAP